MALVCTFLLISCEAEDVDAGTELQSETETVTETEAESEMTEEQAKLFSEMARAVLKVTPLQLDYIVPLKSIVTGEEEYMYCKLQGRGYAAVVLDSGQISECSQQKGGEPDIVSGSDVDYYYAGVMQFWYSDGDAYYDLGTNEMIDEEIVVGAQNVMKDVFDD